VCARLIQLFIKLVEKLAQKALPKKGVDMLEGGGGAVESYEACHRKEEPCGRVCR
jgi:hypothetical protein